MLIQYSIVNNGGISVNNGGISVSYFKFQCTIDSETLWHKFLCSVRALFIANVAHPGSTDTHWRMAS